MRASDDPIRRAWAERNAPTPRPEPVPEPLTDTALDGLAADLDWLDDDQRAQARDIIGAHHETRRQDAEAERLLSAAVAADPKNFLRALRDRSRNGNGSRDAAAALTGARTARGRPVESLTPGALPAGEHAPTPGEAFRVWLRESRGGVYGS